ncbi:hypothetical protein ES288_A05G209900v1 [Gossypium darwinii]|uniref:Uncharacterized protein n=2 Tax=Gossypium TaxID=3633 RepID=A0A5D2QHD3_GOSTO|nr:hypothetical protein ES288_A05G209900v1 [Gossypium darwinii]TYI27991.1 hypothetical protein ES332_A05G213500v1 [Gossypium tomentosum]
MLVTAIVLTIEPKELPRTEEYKNNRGSCITNNCLQKVTSIQLHLSSMQVNPGSMIAIKITHLALFNPRMFKLKTSEKTHQISR